LKIENEEIRSKMAAHNNWRFNIVELAGSVGASGGQASIKNYDLKSRRKLRIKRINKTL
jgi:hypothetical protein